MESALRRIVERLPKQIDNLSPDCRELLLHDLRRYPDVQNDADVSDEFGVSEAAAKRNRETARRALRLVLHGAVLQAKVRSHREFCGIVLNVLPSDYLNPTSRRDKAFLLLGRVSRSFVMQLSVASLVAVSVAWFSPDDDRIERMLSPASRNPPTYARRPNTCQVTTPDSRTIDAKEGDPIRLPGDFSMCERVLAVTVGGSAADFELFDDAVVFWVPQVDFQADVLTVELEYINKRSEQSTLSLAKVRSLGVTDDE